MNKAILLLVVVFVGFWMVSDPHGFAASARTAGGGLWSLTSDLFTSLISVLGDLGDKK